VEQMHSERETIERRSVSAPAAGLGALTKQHAPGISPSGVGLRGGEGGLGHVAEVAVLEALRDVVLVELAEHAELLWETHARTCEPNERTSEEHGERAGGRIRGSRYLAGDRGGSCCTPR